jgi:hypothetical protein
MVEEKHDLRVHRVLDPQRAVLVEFGDALLWRHKTLARRVSGDAHKVEDRPLRRPVVPRGKRRPSLSLSRGGVEKSRQGWHSRQRAQRKAAARTIGTGSRHKHSPFLSVRRHSSARAMGDLARPTGYLLTQPMLHAPLSHGDPASRWAALLCGRPVGHHSVRRMSRTRLDHVQHLRPVIALRRLHRRELPEGN